MRKLLVGVAFVLPLVPAAAAVALALPSAPALPAAPAVPVDFGEGVDGGANPADPSAGQASLVDQQGVKVGVGTNDDGGVTAHVQVGEENGDTSLGRVGASVSPSGVQVYGEDYTPGNVIARATDPLVAAAGLADDDCPAEDNPCDAALVTVTPPADLPAAPALPAPDSGLLDTVTGTVDSLVGGLLK